MPKQAKSSSPKPGEEKLFQPALRRLGADGKSGVMKTAKIILEAATPLTTPQAPETAQTDGQGD